jgi:hypothetical protein
LASLISRCLRATSVAPVPSRRHLREQDGVEERQGRLDEKTRAHQHQADDNRHPSAVQVGHEAGRHLAQECGDFEDRSDVDQLQRIERGDLCLPDEVHRDVQVETEGGAAFEQQVRPVRRQPPCGYRLRYSCSSSGINWLAAGRRRMICFECDGPSPISSGPSRLAAAATSVLCRLLASLSHLARRCR